MSSDSESEGLSQGETTLPVTVTNLCTYSLYYSPWLLAFDTRSVTNLAGVNLEKLVSCINLLKDSEKGLYPKYKLESESTFTRM